ncbi:MAG: ATP-dependent Clp protease ATP-binding subunit [Patescibacteria group bacterium]|nr:ATP-dependent Clp protease ATP-binding subunit [Patescibacteria group bacterium]
MHKRLTHNAQAVIKQLRKATRQSDLSKIDSFSLLQAIKNRKGCLGKVLLDSLNVEPKNFTPNKNQNTNVNKAIIGAAKLAYKNQSLYIGTEHLAQSILSMPEYSHISMLEKKQPPSPLIRMISVQPQNIKADNPQQPDYFGEISSMIEHYFTPQDMPGQKKKSLLKNYCTNLNDKSFNDHVIIGREQELERISHILGRKMKNNPVIIGEPGVGKTAIVEGLAQNINKGVAPYYLIGKRILSLDLGLLIAGTTFRGEFESRLKDIINEIKCNSNIILFIDEIHNLVGAGNAIGGMDAANLLKPVLSRGEIQVIGATTIDEYQKHIEKDAALERRFQPIVANASTVEETVKILTGIKPNYEKYHNVAITQDACMAAATLAKRYITDRFLPDSAIDLIDETAARLRSNLSRNFIYQQVKEMEQKQAFIISKKERLVMNDQYEKAIRARQEEKKISAALEKLKKQLKIFENENAVIIQENDIRTTLSKTSRIPEELLLQQDKQLAKNVCSILSERLVGQPHINKSISDTIIRQLSGISNPNRPLGSFLFIGSSGIGKTHAAKLLAQAISPDGAEALIHINMSEFTERHTASRLLGAPAGYIGYEDGSELTDKIRRKPYSVVLFDEIEKADPSLLNLLLQIFEEGELSDSKGRTINFRNTIIALTSNIGMSDLEKISEIGFSESANKVKERKEKVEQSIIEDLHETLSPEFVNRLDNILTFNQLSKKNIKSIISIEMNELKKRLKNKSVEFSISDKASDHLAEKAFDPKQGARLVRKILQDSVEPLIARILLNRKKIQKIQIDCQKNRIVAKKM